MCERTAKAMLEQTGFDSGDTKADLDVFLENSILSRQEINEVIWILGS